MLWGGRGAGAFTTAGSPDTQACHTPIPVPSTPSLTFPAPLRRHPSPATGHPAPSYSRAARGSLPVRRRSGVLFTSSQVCVLWIITRQGHKMSMQSGGRTIYTARRTTSQQREPGGESNGRRHAFVLVVSAMAVSSEARRWTVGFRAGMTRKAFVTVLRWGKSTALPLRALEPEAAAVSGGSIRDEGRATTLTQRPAIAAHAARGAGNGGLSVTEGKSSPVQGSGRSGVFQAEGGGRRPRCLYTAGRQAAILARARRLRNVNRIQNWVSLRPGGST
ncbi:hypothetical protein AAFF_G00005450 [Aldrovandia affinis]|uniref:Uncharacterized protein n=1 Tax=Aldrovandia affinis TaxID=143900 RepID=A0AAD7TFM5_9TELE|nr:hypothetical protein AAFF_G00005450 [Aldrovandia affinis]